MKLRYVLLVIVVSTAAASSYKSAVRAENRGGVRLNPAFQQLTLTQNVNALEESVILTSSDDTATTYSISAVDMGALDETGGVLFAGLSSEYLNKYGLAKWINIEKSEVVIEPHASVEIKYKVSNLGDLSPGGHYGALIFKNQDQLPTSDKIGFEPKLAMPLFVRKIGGEKFGVSVSNRSLHGSLWKMPDKVELDFTNTGNVHIVPRGVVSLSGPLGFVKSRGIINLGSSIILPEKHRKLVVDLLPKRHFSWPGRYHALVEYRYDGKTDFEKLDIYFWTWNLYSVFQVAGAVLVAALAVWRFDKKFGSDVRTKLRRFVGWIFSHLARQKSYFGTKLTQVIPAGIRGRYDLWRPRKTTRPALESGIKKKIKKYNKTPHSK